MSSGEGDGLERWEAAVRAEVGAGWWDDPDGADLRARFKAFTGQRCDWPEPKLLFWKDLILRVARRLRLCSAPAHLEEMRADGEILLKSELIDPAAGSLYQILWRVSQMAISKRPIAQEDILVFRSLVEVHEAIQIGIKAMKEHDVSIEDINTHLKEVDDLVAAQREIDAALELVPLHSLAGEEDIEEQFRNLEAELLDKIPDVHVEEPEPVLHATEDSPDETAESLSDNLSKIKLGAI
ncbi:hypothetical protein ACQ4PT_065190 [Festuca glaucescens]